jgi:hypothetical protein
MPTAQSVLDQCLRSTWDAAYKEKHLNLLYILDMGSEKKKKKKKKKIKEEAESD